MSNIIEATCEEELAPNTLKATFIEAITITWEDVDTQFSLILENIDYKSFYSLLQLRPYNILKKKKAAIELKGLFFALWRLNLEHTFKEQGTDFFLQSLEKSAKNHILSNQGKKSYLFYWEALLDKKEADFSKPAELIRDLLVFNNKKIHTIVIALYLRNLFQYIQNNLVNI